jgi:hypothetical protein
VGSNVVGGHGSHERACLQRGAGNMWQKHNIFYTEQFRLDGWLVLENVQARTGDGLVLRPLTFFSPRRIIMTIFSFLVINFNRLVA